MSKLIPPSFREPISGEMTKLANEQPVVVALKCSFVDFPTSLHSCSDRPPSVLLRRSASFQQISNDDDKSITDFVLSARNMDDGSLDENVLIKDSMDSASSLPPLDDFSYSSGLFLFEEEAEEEDEQDNEDVEEDEDEHKGKESRGPEVKAPELCKKNDATFDSFPKHARFSVDAKRFEHVSYRAQNNLLAARMA